MASSENSRHLDTDRQGGEGAPMTTTPEPDGPDPAPAAVPRRRPRLRLTGRGRLHRRLAGAVALGLVGWSFAVDLVWLARVPR